MLYMTRNEIKALDHNYQLGKNTTIVEGPNLITLYIIKCIFLKGSFNYNCPCITSINFFKYYSEYLKKKIKHIICIKKLVQTLEDVVPLKITFNKFKIK